MKMMISMSWMKVDIKSNKILNQKAQKAQKAQTVRMNYQAEKNQRKIIQVAKFKLNPRNWREKLLKEKILHQFSSDQENLGCSDFSVMMIILV